MVILEFEIRVHMLGTKATKGATFSSPVSTIVTDSLTSRRIVVPMWLWLTTALLGTAALALLGWGWSAWRSDKHVVRRSTIYSAPIKRQPNSILDPAYIREDPFLRSRHPSKPVIGIHAEPQTNVPYSPLQEYPTHYSPVIELHHDQETPNEHNYTYDLPRRPLTKLKRL